MPYDVIESEPTTGYDIIEDPKESAGYDIVPEDEPLSGPSMQPTLGPIAQGAPSTTPNMEAVALGKIPEPLKVSSEDQARVMAGLETPYVNVPPGLVEAGIKSLPFLQGVPLPEQFVEGAAESGAQIISGLTSPAMLAAMPAFATPIVGQVAAAGLGAVGVVQGGKRLISGLAAGDVRELGASATELVASGAMLVGGAKAGAGMTKVLLPKALKTLQATRRIVPPPALPSESFATFAARETIRGQSPSGVAKKPVPTPTPSPGVVPIPSITSAKEYSEATKKYGIPNSTESPPGVFSGKPTGEMFIDDATGKPVAYAGPEVPRPGPTGQTALASAETVYGNAERRLKREGLGWALGVFSPDNSVRLDAGVKIRYLSQSKQRLVAQVETAYRNLQEAKARIQSNPPVTSKDPNAVQEQGAAPVPARDQSQVGQQMGSEIPNAQTTPGTPPTETPVTPQSMGGALYDEMNRKPTGFMAMKMADINASRVERGLAPILKQDPRSVDQSIATAMQWIDNAMDKGKVDLPKLLSEELVQYPRTISAEENYVLQLGLADRRDMSRRLGDDLALAIKDGRTEEQAKFQSLWNDNDAVRQQIEVASSRSGSERGRALQSLQTMMAEDYSLGEMLHRAQAANGGKPIDAPGKTGNRDYLAKLSATAQDLQKKIEGAQGKTSGGGAGPSLDAGIEKIRKQARGPRPPGTPAERIAKTTELLRERVKDDGRNDIATLAQRLARVFVEQDLKISRDALVDKVHAVLTDIDPTFTRPETMDAISGYGNFTPLSKNVVTRVLSDLKGQLQQVGKLRDIADKLPPRKSGYPRRVPSTEERGLIKQVEEGKRKGEYIVTDPETQLRTALGKIKARVQNQIADLDAQIVAREKTVKTRTPIKHDQEYLDLVAIRDKKKQLFDEVFADPVADEAARFDRWSKAIKRRTAEYERRLKEQDFSPRPPRRERPQGNEADTLQLAYESTQRKYYEKLAEFKRSQWSLGYLTWQKTLDLLRDSRTVITSYDLSAVLRQGKFFVAGHPIRASKSIVPMLKAFKSELGQRAIENEIMARKNYRNGMYRKAGLYLADSRGSLAMREEAFMATSRVEKVPGVAASQRAYNTFLNKFRADLFDYLSTSLTRTGEPTLVEAKAIANLINKGTGRGSFGAKERTYVGLNTIFFSPRFVASRFQLIAGQPFAVKSSFRVRKMIAKEYIRSLAGVAAVLTLAEMAGDIASYDPTSSDFMKIKLGNTRIDLLAGLQQTLVLLARTKTGTKMSVSGREAVLRGDKKTYGAGNVWNNFVDFGRSKLAPGVSFFVDLGVGETVAGEKVTGPLLLERTLIPMSFQGLLDTWEDVGLTTGTGLLVLSLLGEGVKTYTDRPAKTTTGRKSRTQRNPR